MKAEEFSDKKQACSRVIRSKIRVMMNQSEQQKNEKAKSRNSLLFPCIRHKITEESQGDVREFFLIEPG